MGIFYDQASQRHSGHPVTKPLSYYRKFDDFLTKHNIVPKKILEIGTFEGESTKILSHSFPDSQILTIDIKINNIDFSGFNNIVYKQADQTDKEILVPLITNYFPEGVDLIIEDASHIGYYSKLTFDLIFPLLIPGGAYFIEDWGTGYWDEWIDGNRFQNFPLLPHNNNIPKRIQSHDYGMVGFVKSLVDLTHERAIKNKHSDEAIFSSRIETLEFGEGVCMLKKS